MRQLGGGEGRGRLLTTRALRAPAPGRARASANAGGCPCPPEAGGGPDLTPERAVITSRVPRGLRLAQSQPPTAGRGPGAWVAAAGVTAARPQRVMTNENRSAFKRPWVWAGLRSGCRPAMPRAESPARGDASAVVTLAPAQSESCSCPLAETSTRPANRSSVQKHGTGETPSDGQDVPDGDRDPGLESRGAGEMFAAVTSGAREPVGTGVRGWPPSLAAPPSTACICLLPAFLLPALGTPLSANAPPASLAPPPGSPACVFPRGCPACPGGSLTGD